jgi:hypothetical protein
VTWSSSWCDVGLRGMMGCGISFVCSDVFFFLVMFCDDVEMAKEEGSRWMCCLFSVLVLLDRW